MVLFLLYRHPPPPAQSSQVHSHCHQNPILLPKFGIRMQELTYKKRYFKSDHPRKAKQNWLMSSPIPYKKDYIDHYLADRSSYLSTVHSSSMAMPRKDLGDFVFEEFVPSAAWKEDSTCHCLLVRLPGFKKEWLKLQVDNYGHVLVSGERQERKTKFIHFYLKFELPENSDVENISGRYEGETLYVTIPKEVEEEEGWNRTANSVEEKREDSKEDEKGDKGIANDVEKKQEDSKEDEKREKRDANGVEKKHKHMKEKEQEQDKGTGNGAEEKHEQKEQRDDGHSYPHEKDENTEMAREESREFNFLGSFVDILNKNKQVVISAVLAFSLGLLVSRKFQSNIGREDHSH